MSWLQSEESGDLGTFFARFLDRQGHRGIREVKKSMGKIFQMKIIRKAMMSQIEHIQAIAQLPVVLKQK